MTFDLVLRGGHVLDPANERDGVMDVAISGDRIVAMILEGTLKEGDPFRHPEFLKLRPRN